MKFLSRNQIHKIGSAVGIALIVNITFASLAMAQTTTAPSSTSAATPAAASPNSNSNIVFSKTTFAAAQVSSAACVGTNDSDSSSFKAKLWNASSQAFKATWVDGDDPIIPTGEGGFAESSGSGLAKGCYIISGSGGDGVQGVVTRTPAAANLENLIKNSTTGISAQVFTDAQSEDLKEQGQAGPISAAVGWVLDALLSTVAMVLGQGTAMAAQVFSTVADNIIHITATPRVVQQAWAIIRDVSNMFFILILIVIALAAILRIEEYDYRHLLGELVIMAILVNFSMVIAQTLINVVNFVAAIFYGNGFGLTEVYTQIMKISGAFDTAKTLYDQSLNGGWSGALTIGLGRIAFMIVGFVVFLALAGMFVIRLVGLYVLIIFSPIAYVADILPATKNFAHEWWHKFIHYLLWAPVAMFMLRIVFLLTANGGTDGFETGTQSSLTFFILTGFLAAAVLVAEEAGMVGSKAVMQIAEKTAHMGLEYMDMSLAKGAASKSRVRRGLSYFSIGAAQRGWKMRFQEKEHQAYAQASGKRADQFNKIISRGKEKTEFEVRAVRALWLDEMKKNQTSDSDELRHVVQAGIEARNPNEVAGALLKLANDGNINDWAGGTTAQHLQEAIKKLHVGPNAVMSEADAMRLGLDISKIAENGKQMNFADAFGMHHGDITARTETDRQQIIQRKMARGNPQDWSRNTGRLGSGFDITNKKKMVNGHEVEDQIIEKVDPHGLAHFGNITDMQNLNTEMVTYSMLGASKDMYDSNSDLWLTAAERFTKLSPHQQDAAYNMATTTENRIVDGQRFGWAKNTQGVIEKSSTIVKDQVERLVAEGKVKQVDLNDGGKYANLGRYAGVQTPVNNNAAGGGNTNANAAQPIQPNTPNRPTVPPIPPGWAAGPGGQIIMPPSNTP